MPDFVVSPPRDVVPARDGHRASREPPQTGRIPVALLAPVMFAPAAAVVVLLAEAAAVIRLIVGAVLLVPLLAAARPTEDR